MCARVSLTSEVLARYSIELKMASCLESRIVQWSFALLFAAATACRFGYEIQEEASSRREQPGDSLGGAGGDAPIADVGGTAGTGGSGTGAEGGDTGTDLGPFEPPQALTALNSGAGDDDPSITDDLLEIYFSSRRLENTQGIWRSKRESTSDPWPAPEEMTELNIGTEHSMPGVTSDGLSIYYKLVGAQGTELYVAHRADRSSPFSAPEFVASFSYSTYQTYNGPCAIRNLTLLTYSSETQSDEGQLYFSTRDSKDEAWGPRQLFPNVNTSADERDPWISDDRLHLFFSSDRDGNGELYATTRGDASVDFDIPSNMSELNGSADEGDPWLTQDLRTIVFSSNRSGVTSLYISHR